MALWRVAYPDSEYPTHAYHSPLWSPGAHGAASKSCDEATRESPPPRLSFVTFAHRSHTTHPHFAWFYPSYPAGPQPAERSGRTDLWPLGAHLTHHPLLPSHHLLTSPRHSPIHLNCPTFLVPPSLTMTTPQVETAMPASPAAPSAKPSPAAKAASAIARSRARAASHAASAVAAFDSAREQAERVAAHPHAQKAIAVGKGQIGRLRVALGHSETVMAAEQATGVDRVSIVAGAVAL